jgi:hypothetical protein
MKITGPMTKNYNFLTPYVGLLAVSGLLALCFMMVEVQPPNNDIKAQILAMPDSAYKSNLLTVMGAYYGNSSEELNEILQMYSRMKIEEMSKNRSL